MMVNCMGKDFQKELRQISGTYTAVEKKDVTVIKRFLDCARTTPIILIGSGGSYSVAVAAEYLLRRMGLFCKAVTPLELSQYKNQLSDFSAILFTAGGRNSDTLNTYNYLNELELRAFLTLCMSEHAPIAKLQRPSSHSMYFDFAVPSGKDGFLAVNSTIASVSLLAKALYEFSGDAFYCLPQDFSWDATLSLKSDELHKLLAKDTLLVLHGGITTPAAYDLESKFSEAALGNIQLVDFRNFAHGRHYWVSTRSEHTAVLVLGSLEERSIIQKTSSILSDNIACSTLCICQEDIAGLLKSFASVFSLVSAAGDYHSMNPGRPQVAAFGRKLYHLSHNPCMMPDHRSRRRSILQAASHRKAVSNGYYDEQMCLSAAKAYLSKLQSRRFSGIIFDYDDTLSEKSGDELIQAEVWAQIDRLLTAGIRIGIATGRGKSVRQELQTHIDKRFWDAVAVGYYNGSCLASLADTSQPDKTLPVLPELVYAKEIADQINVNETVKIELRPTQLTVTCDNGYALNCFVRLCKEKLHIYSSIKFVESKHSVDIISAATQKTNTLNFFTKGKTAPGEFLFVGDSGYEGGNDFEMLCNSYSLSVDYVSSTLDSCWNFAPLGTRNTAATLFYLEHTIVSKETHSFTVKLA